MLAAPPWGASGTGLGMGGRMTKDEIIRMAREAGFKLHHNPDLYDCMVASDKAIERFAALVAAPLQERIQDLYRQLNEAERELDSQYKLGMEAEREACAKVCEPWLGRYPAIEIMNAIRARGQA